MKRNTVFMYGFIHAATMLSMTIWSSMQAPIWSAGHLFNDPWFMATLVDAYLGFLAFFLWVLLVEKTWLKKAAWFIALMCLGNIAMGIYIMVRAYQLPETATARDIILGESR